jgi:PhzF family phenazine biosynthesis protein
MRISFFQVDAFCNQPFKGNPATVCLLPYWLSDFQLQQMASEHHLPVTAFLVKQGTDFTIKWFTPQMELELCGHGTLAAAFVIFHCLDLDVQNVNLHSSTAGIICVKRKNEWIEFAFPAKAVVPVDKEDALAFALGATPIETYHGGHERLMVVLKDEQAVYTLQPDRTRLSQWPYRGIIVTAASARVDFVSRTFYPQKPMMEDAVTGASHCYLAPFWAKRLAKTFLHAEQISARGGTLLLEVEPTQILIRAQAVLYAQGSLELSDQSMT